MRERKERAKDLAQKAAGDGEAATEQLRQWEIEVRRCLGLTGIS